MEKVKVKVANKKDWEQLEKEQPENIIQMIQQSDGSFQVKSSHELLPIFIVNEVLTQLHKIYKNMMFDKAYDNLPEEHKKYQQYLERKCRAQRRWTLFWYALFLCAIGYIIIGGR